MPNRKMMILASVLACMVGSAMAQTPEHPVTLSKAQKQRLAKAIKVLNDPGERRMAQQWSTAKQVAEWLCRPVALRTLHEQHPDIDQVFLGTGDKDDLDLVSNRLLRGKGEARSGSEWKTFTFTCELDPHHGDVSNFAEHFDS